MNEQVTSVLIDILIIVISAGVTWVGWYLKKRWGIEKMKAIAERVNTAVHAAEMIGAKLGWSGSQKKEYVVEQIGRVLKINADELNRLIEAAVAALKAAGEELAYTESKVGKGADAEVVRTVVVKAQVAAKK